MLLKWFQRMFAAFGAASLASCATPAPGTAEPVARPALWQVADADTKIYLFGTIHRLPEGYRWRSPALQEAIDRSQELVVELDLNPKDAQLFMSELQRLGFAQGLPPIAERVGPAHRAALEQAIAKSGQPRFAFDQMETWAAGFILLIQRFQQLGLSGEEGVEATIKNDFTARNKPVAQLETIADQFSIFDTLPEKAQRELLEGAVGPEDEFRQQFDLMLAAWTRGDTREIAKAFNQDTAESPELREALIQRRNSNWSRWIARRMAQPGTLMVAVGAGHLAGEDSVVDLLERDGYRVKRVQ